MVKLLNIANIRIGYNFRRESTSKNDRNLSNASDPIPVIQPRDIEMFNSINTKNLDTTILTDNGYKYFLFSDEILFSNKGDFKASVWRGNKKVIASSAFYRIRLIDKNYLPDFVALYLNSPLGKSQLNLRHNTERVSTITISDVEQIDIPLIPLEKQKQIVELFLLYEKEVDTMEKIKQNRKKLINSILSQTIKE